MLTIVTPTYNRAHTLPKVYASLLNQTSKKFTWLIVDDGSTDNTEQLVSNWIAENRLQIQYFKKENGGKASALNVGIDHLQTTYAVCLDSDDIFYPNAVESALIELDSIEGDDACCGLLALRNNPDGSVMGHIEIPKEMAMVTAQDIFLRLHLKTELICFYKVSILKNYRFPEFKGEKFVSPAWMQYEITQRYKYKASGKKYCQCEYIDDGLTKNKNKLIIKNPKGYTCVKRFSFDLAPSLIQRMKHGIMYDCGCIIGHDKNWLKNVNHKVWAILLWPAGWFVSKTRFK